jgi:methyltransferase
LSAEGDANLAKSPYVEADRRNEPFIWRSLIMLDSVGWPQFIALILLLQRGLEELHSQRNTRALIAAGAREVGRTYYPVVAITHLAWIASIYLLVPAAAQIHPILAILYLILQFVRYWVIATLGGYWTHRIFTLDNAPVIRRGPYRFLRHPNYAVTIAETFLLPMVFGCFALGIIMGAIWSVVLSYKILLEDEGLSERRQQTPTGRGTAL